MWVAARSEVVGSSFATYVIENLVLIDWRSANSGSEVKSIIE